jgi:acylphosphatase
MEMRLRVVVHGLVQGVFFRESARRAAFDLGVTGFVRNRPDGTVEIEAEGPRDRLDLLAEWAQHGPPSARVDRIEAGWGHPTGEFSTFRIAY